MKKINNEKPLESSNFFDVIFFTYIYKVIKIGSKRKYQKSDLFKLKKTLLFENFFSKFIIYYKKKKKEKKTSANIIIKYMIPIWFKSFIFHLIGEIITIFLPFFLREIINWFNDPEGTTKRGYILCTLILIVFLIKEFGYEHGKKIAYESSVQLTHVIFGLIFYKLENIDLKYIKYIKIGQITSSLTSDVFRLIKMGKVAYMVIVFPILITIFSTVIIYQIGWIGAVGLLFLFFYSIVYLFVVHSFSRILRFKLNLSDKRNTTVQSSLSGIKSIKFNAWEKVIISILDGIRRKEKKYIFLYNFLRVIYQLLSFFGSTIASFICISMFHFLEGEISIGQSFFIVMLFNLFANPFKYFFFFLMNFFEAIVIFKRLDHIMDFPDSNKEESLLFNDEELNKGEVKIINGNFCYNDLEMINKIDKFENISNKKKNFKNTINENESKQMKLILENINMNVKKGEFLAIIGEVGSGKSSLLRVISKSLFTKSGKILKNGKISYIPQKSFLMNETIKNNIIFGNKENNLLFKKILEISQLNEDLKNFPSNEYTEIGERGINLSGGQKQRIGIARALYSDADIYLIDDCLSALDSHVGKKIFEKVFKKYLKNKTRIMVTHSLQYLDKVDSILFLNKNGKIECQGNYEDLIKNNENFRIFLSELEKKKEKDKDEENRKNYTISQSFSRLSEKNNLIQNLNKKNDLIKNIDREKKLIETKIKKGKLMKEEKNLKGIFDYKMYYKYIKGGGVLLFLFCFFLFFIIQALRALSDYWIGIWATNKYSFTTTKYFYIYLIFVFLLLLIGLLVAIFWGIFASRSSFKIFNTMISQIFNKIITFFDITPIGQLLNLTSKDTDMLDSRFPGSFQNIILQSIQYLVTILIMIISSFLSLPFIIVFIIFVIILFRFYIKTSIELRRLEQLAYSPLISNISEFYNGIIIFRGFNKIQHIKTIFIKNVNVLVTAFYHDTMTEVFLGLFLSIGNILLFVLTIFFFVTGKVFKWEFVVNDPTFIAVTINYMFIVGIHFNFLIFMFGETLKGMASVERIFKNIDKKMMERSLDIKAPKNWPKNGEIEVKGVFMKYRKDLPYVLNNLSFKIKPGEKIGVVGRTGSGKSTLILALTRLLELDQEGNDNFISIDGIKTFTIDLSELRSKIKVIPQDPYLIKGSLRLNLDPLKKYKDEKIIEVLKKCLIWDSNLFNVNEEKKDKINIKNKNKLNFFIENNGDNLSLGQKQLICIGRALLEIPKVLLMDEATSNIDQNTDKLIQIIIKREFKDSTIITIAHRLNTIIEYDKILVLDKGKIVEADSPINLLNKEGSIFNLLVKQSGKEFRDKMIELAKKSDN